MQLSNYHKAVERARSLFLNCDIRKKAEAYGLRTDDQYAYIVFFSREYRICFETGVIDEYYDEVWKEAGHDSAMTLYDVIGLGDASAKASGEFINQNSLVSTISAAGNPGKGLDQAWSSKFDGHEEALKKGCEALRGHPAGKGDIAYELPMFDFLNCRFQFWSSDEDFPAQTVIFVDKNILQFMKFETTWYAVAHMLRRIAEEAGLAPKKEEKA